MANTRAWEDATRGLGINFGGLHLNTPETYLLIREMGLPTVFWKKYSIKNERDLEKMLKGATGFIQRKSPCLFIWDPIDPDLHKGYFVNVKNPQIIIDWVRDNKKDVQKYDYLMTTQIINSGNGFVGNAISDGRGRMFVETLHTPGVCNHRDLTQPQKKDDGYFEFFSVENFELASIGRGLLSGEQLRRIIETYSDREGFFEFNYGEHLGNLGAYTVGFQKEGIFSFPSDLHSYYARDVSGRARARGYNQFL